MFPRESWMYFSSSGEICGSSCGSLFTIFHQKKNQISTTDPITVSCSVTLNSTDSGMPWRLHEVEAFAQCLNQLRDRVGVPPLNYYFAEEYCVLAYDAVYSDKLALSGSSFIR